MSTIQHYDVLIVGAGLSGIGAARHLQKECPGTRYRILESRDAIGGTWDLFRYPGIRSDSDMFTLGYEFKPWNEGKVLADGPAIRAYVEDTARENGIIEHIDFGQQVSRADWCSDSASWTLSTHNKDKTERRQYRANMLLLCAGYYSYKTAYWPEYPDQTRFKGELIHPQFWPEALDYSGKKVIIIGSGATAVTLVPAMAEQAEQVTMLQRSPSYLVNRPQYDALHRLLRPVLPDTLVYRLVRWKNAKIQRLVYAASRHWPGLLKKHFINAVRKQLPENYDVGKHFTPDYNPWDQRLCAVPDNDMFEAIRSGKADVLTDEIERFSENGIVLTSGQELAADIIVSATGLQLAVNGEIEFYRDGEAIHFPDTWSYKGMMFSGVPNLVATFGYINASWTLRADMIARYFCRLLNHLKDTGLRQVTPVLRASDQDMPARPWILDFPSGYIQRSMPHFPRQGDREPWLNTQNYDLEKRSIGRASLDDGVLQFSSPQATASDGETAGNKEPPLAKSA